MPLSAQVFVTSSFAKGGRGRAGHQGCAGQRRMGGFGPALPAPGGLADQDWSLAGHGMKCAPWQPVPTCYTSFTLASSPPRRARSKRFMLDSSLCSQPSGGSCWIAAVLGCGKGLSLVRAEEAIVSGGAIPVGHL